MNSILPFSFLPIIHDGDRVKSKFIDNVEKVLLNDIQSPESFGCKIKDCHTHAGSKMHFKDFIEAELLFHNSYYNQGFAFLTVQYIIAAIGKLETEEEKANEIILVGYETYSELYLQEVRRQLENYFQRQNGNGQIKNMPVYYCVYETYAKNDEGVRKTTAKIRNLIYDPNSKCRFSVNYGIQTDTTEDKKLNQLSNPLIVFIVPINTSLSTMDKMMSKFKKQVIEQYRQYSKKEKQITDDRAEEIKNEIEGRFESSIKLCLITIQPSPKQKNPEKSNIYWQLQPDGSKEELYYTLTPKKKRFTELKGEGERGNGKEDEIVSFAMVHSEWHIVNTAGSEGNEFCELCFPDQHNKSLLDEKPIFDVTRGSVVPMLQMGKALPGEPAKPYDGIAFENLRRVSVLMKHTSHRHLSQGEDHFQFFFDTMGFLNDEWVCKGEDAVYKSINNFLKEQDEKRKEQDTVVYNYIIAPRHNNNAKWVSVVNAAFQNADSDDKKIQYGTVRTLYFDITKEYRSNLKAKYSDFYREIRNVMGSELNSRIKEGQKAPKIEIRFHYVDITIASGHNIQRAADLVRSLLPIEAIQEASQTVHISLFETIFLLYCRSSKDTKAYYSNIFKGIEENSGKTDAANRIYSYVNINISHMRSYEDACTLCRLKNDYNRIREECATNRLADICSKVIQNHEVLPVANFSQYICSGNEENMPDVFQAEEEKQYLLFISHLINERISGNRAVFKDEPKDLPLESESVSSFVNIVKLMADYYEHLFVDKDGNIQYLKKTIQQNEKQQDEKQLKLKTAFIKSISRPFFVYHLRKRQAAFSFCLQQLDDIIKNYNKENNQAQLILANTLVKALCDMNANYIIRSSCGTHDDKLYPFDALVKMAMDGDCELEKESADNYIRKNLFTTENYLHYIKKMLSLSQDKTKSILLENILVKGCEDGFFVNHIATGNYNLGEAFLFNRTDNEKKDGIHELSIRGKLYLENNKVLIDAFSSNEPPINSLPYYLDNCNSILVLNSTSEANPGEIDANAKAKMSACYSCYQEISRITKDKEIIKQLDTLSGLICNKLKEAINPGIEEVTLFVRNKSVSTNELIVNKFFEFFRLGSDNEIREDNGKTFYCDTNFSKLREMVKYMDDRKGCDVCVKEDQVLVRFCAKESDRNSPDDESIYMICDRFDFSIESWFYLKFAMLLRNEIVKLMNGINMSTTISGLNNAMSKKALGINKAITHSDSEIYMTMKFAKAEGIEDPEHALGHYQDYTDEKIVKSVLEKYLQLISNEWLSSIYRKLVREEELYSSLVALFSQIAQECEAEEVKEDLQEFFGIEIDNSFEITMSFVGTGSNRDVSIKVSGIKNFDIYEKVASFPKIGTIMPFEILLCLFAGNVVNHSDMESSELSVQIDETGTLRFSNSTQQQSTELNSSERYLDVYPWVRKEKEQHLTLWTLYHYMNVINRVLHDLKDKDKIKVDLPEDAFAMDVPKQEENVPGKQEDAKFTVEFKHFLYGRREKNER